LYNADTLRVEEKLRAREIEVTHELSPSGAEKRGQRSELVTILFDLTLYVLIILGLSA
jgi:hypothetical protein